MNNSDDFLQLIFSNPITIERMQCTVDEKEDLVQIIELFAEMTERSRQVGYNCMSYDYFDRINNSFFRTAILLRLATNTSEFMLHSLLPCLLLSDERGKEFTEKLLILYGITKLTQGETSAYIKVALYSFIGLDKGIEEFVKELM